LKPFSQAAENNAGPILEVLRTLLAERTSVLEIGSGTGQHAACFGAALPRLVWQTSDCRENHAGIRAWVEEAGLANVRAPIALDVLVDAWPPGPFDAAFSANTAHIMSEEAVAAMFGGLGRLLPAGAPFALYGPFFIEGEVTAPSNVDFDRRLRARDPHSGVRQLSRLERVAAQACFALEDVLAMPANNRLVVWRRTRDPAGCCGPAS
jgi:hypothetical protein